MLEKLYLYYYKIRNFNYYIFLYLIKPICLHEKKLDEITQDTKIITIIIIFIYFFSAYKIRIP